MPARRLLSALSLLGKCVCKSILLAAVINISSCKNSAQQAWARPAEFLSFDHLRFPPYKRRVPEPCKRPPALRRQPCASPGTHALPPPASPLLFYLRICCQNSNELSIMWPRHFPTEALSPADSGSSRNSEKKRGQRKNSFQLFFMFHSFLPLSPPHPRPPPLRGSLPPPPSSALPYPLYVTRIAQIEAQEGPIGNAQDPWEKKAPNKLYTRCITLYGQTGKHKS